MRYVLPSLAAVAICAFGVAATAAPGDSPQSAAGMERMRQWSADHEALLNAKLAGLKAGLKLTPDQEKLWPPFETAVRRAAKLRMDQMKAMMMDRMQMQDRMDQMQGAPSQGASPVDRLDALAQRILDRGTAIKKVADAAKPLYASLDDSQKRLLGLLGRELLMMGHGHRGMGMMGESGMMGEGGTGMMGREPSGMNMTRNPPNDDEDSSDEE